MDENKFRKILLDGEAFTPIDLLEYGFTFVCNCGKKLSNEQEYLKHLDDSRQYYRRISEMLSLHEIK